MKRVFMITAEALGAGSMSGEYNTMKEFAKIGQMPVKALRQFGFSNIEGLAFLGTVPRPLGIDARIVPASEITNTEPCYWELLGVENTTAFIPYGHSDYDQRVKKKVVRELKNRTGHAFLLTDEKAPEDICAELQSLKNCDLDFAIGFDKTMCHIAAKEENITRDQLCRVGKIACNVFSKENRVTCIHTYFYKVEKSGETVVTSSKYFVHKQANGNLIEAIRKNKQRTVSVGRLDRMISDRFISRVYREKTDIDVLQKLLKVMNTRFNGLCVADLPGLALDATEKQHLDALAQLDRMLLRIMCRMKEEDILIVVGARGAGKTKEYLPMIIYGPAVLRTGNMGSVDTPADLAATIADYLGVPFSSGNSFLQRILKKT